MITSYSQTPDQVVQQQLEAYNARNIDAFMAVFHPDIELWTLGADAPSAVGWEKVKILYGVVWASAILLPSTIMDFFPTSLPCCFRCLS